MLDFIKCLVKVRKFAKGTIIIIILTNKNIVIYITTFYNTP